jgi:hypothetical protein
MLGNAMRRIKKKLNKIIYGYIFTISTQIKGLQSPMQNGFFKTYPGIRI